MKTKAIYEKNECSSSVKSTKEVTNAKTEVSYQDFLHTINRCEKTTVVNVLDSSEKVTPICNSITHFLTRVDPFTSIENRPKPKSPLKVDVVVHDHSGNPTSRNKNVAVVKSKGKSNVSIVENDFDLSITHVDTTLVDMNKTIPTRKRQLRETDSPKKDKKIEISQKHVFNIFNIKSPQNKNDAKSEQMKTDVGGIVETVVKENKVLPRTEKKVMKEIKEVDLKNDVVIVSSERLNANECRKAVLAQQIASMGTVKVDSKRKSQSMLDFGQKSLPTESRKSVEENTAELNAKEKKTKPKVRSKKGAPKSVGCKKDEAVHVEEVLDGYSSDTVEYTMEVVKTPKSTKKKQPIKIKFKR